MRANQARQAAELRMDTLAKSGHQCAVTHPCDDGTSFKCPTPAFRKNAAGQWMCRKHHRMMSGRS